ncbi:MAG: hypothetical protein KJ622_04050 [Alphaproteobacteria bacterium]|nr:hypothetical protein [Alphaproteobacteria bacterium]
MLSKGSVDQIEMAMGILLHTSLRSVDVQSASKNVMAPDVAAQRRWASGGALDVTFTEIVRRRMSPRSGDGHPEGH